MSNDEYKKREVDSFLENMQRQLNRIEESVKKESIMSNNNQLELTRLETRINTMIWVFGILLPIILSLISWIFFNELASIKDLIEETQASIPEQVSMILDSMEFEIIE